MLVKVIFDKTAKYKKLHTGWGISLLVDGRVVFDTGESGPRLMENMALLKTDIEKIEAAVISHDHWDHKGGLWKLLEARRGLAVYACRNFSAEFKEKVQAFGGDLIEVKNKRMISGGIFVTGESAGEYKGEYMPEQALVVKTGRGISVLTGCAHPGILKMLSRAGRSFPGEGIYAVLGGFHLADQASERIKMIAGGFRRMGVKKAGPAHCSGAKAERIFRAEFGRNFLKIQAGTELTL